MFLIFGINSTRRYRVRKYFLIELFQKHIEILQTELVWQIFLQ